MATINYVEQAGNATLKIVDGVYTVETADGDVVLKRPNGNDFVTNSAFAYTLIEPLADGSGFVALAEFTDGSISLRQFDNAGHITAFTAPRRLTALARKKPPSAWISTATASSASQWRPSSSPPPRP